jgi:hypothetical protein
MRSGIAAYYATFLLEQQVNLSDKIPQVVFLALSRSPLD